TSSVVPGCRMIKSSGRPSSSASITRSTSSSITSAPKFGTEASKALSSAKIADCMSMGWVMSGHHVEGDHVAVIALDAVDVPGFAVHDESALAVERLQVALLHCVRAYPINRPLAKTLDVLLDNHRHSVRQHL